MRQAERDTAFFKRRPQISIHHRKEDKPGMLRYLWHDALDMAGGADHRPIMADGFNIIELRKRSLRDCFECFAR
jgi:hypothetical protein